MYRDFYGISEPPFSIVPSARFLYLSERHREALTHMLSSLSGGGGFGLLTGEVGTGKTTVLRALVTRLPQETQVAVILNPSYTTLELLASICDEFGISYPESATVKQMTDAIYQHLLDNHKNGTQSLLLIDEAQHLMPDVLEQLRLLTNLETDSIKLLKVVLVGQPELQQLLQQERLRQLAQRITSRYHLLPLTQEEVSEYINYRLRAVDCLHNVFSTANNQIIAKATGGIPRLINLVCDKAMQLGFQRSMHQIPKELVEQACQEVLDWQLPTLKSVETKKQGNKRFMLPLAAAVAGVAVLGAGYGLALWSGDDKQHDSAASVSVLPVVASQPVSPTPAAVVAEAVQEIVAQQPNQPVYDPRQAAVNWMHLVNQSASERHAMQSLYRMWGYDTQLSQANCESSGRVGLSCYKGQGDLEQLGLINRTAILTLTEPGGIPYYAILYAVRRDSVELLLANQRVSVKPEWLAARWDGEYTLLWRPPLGDKGAIRYGQQGPRVRWLDDQLSALLGVQQSRDDIFGQGLLEKLRRFQKAQGLSVDGIAGPRTLMVVDAAMNLPGPTLQPQATAQEPLDNSQQLPVEITAMAYPVLDAEPLPLYSRLVPLEPSSTPQAQAAGQTGAEPPALISHQADQSGDEGWDLNAIDYSDMSPELASHLKSAIAATSDGELPAEEPVAVEEKAKGADTIDIADLPVAVQNRIPTLNFQTHIYSSNKESRWVKVNGKEAFEGDSIAPGVLLRSIEPRRVVFDFESYHVSMPALSEW